MVASFRWLVSLVAVAGVSSCLQPGPDGQSTCDGLCAGTLVCDEATGKCVVPSSGNTAHAGDVPCEVASVVNHDCVSCHGTPLTGGAPMRLTDRADFAARSSGDTNTTLGQRAVIRMRQSVSAMPPAPQPPVSSEAVAAFEAWVVAGMPAGACGSSSGSDAGVVVPRDAGLPSPFDGGIDGLPCEVAAFVANKCATCHQRPPVGGASFALLGRADFFSSSSAAGQTMGQRSSVRLHDSFSPMPPVGQPGASSSEIAAFDAWVSAGMPVGSCGAIDAGTTDAGPSPTVCTSGSSWSSGNNESPDMNPGLACKACHASKAISKNYPFSGTVYPSLHEKDLCNSRPPSGVSVQIIDKNGKVALTLTPRAGSGNFHSSLFASVAMPFTARITANGKTATMKTPQTSGDCNSCHTEQGLNGAAGRLMWP